MLPDQDPDRLLSLPELFALIPELDLQATSISKQGKLVKVERLTRAYDVAMRAARDPAAASDVVAEIARRQIRVYDVSGPDSHAIRLAFPQMSKQLVSYNAKGIRGALYQGISVAHFYQILSLKDHSLRGMKALVDYCDKVEGESITDVVPGGVVDSPDLSVTKFIDIPTEVCKRLGPTANEVGAEFAVFVRVVDGERWCTVRLLDRGAAP